MGYKYVASPYSSIDPVTREHRFLTLCEFIADRCHVESLYSPILHWHRIAQILEMPKEEEFWWHSNKAMLDAADGMIVFMMLGWEESRGVRREIEYAAQINKPIEYIR